MKDEFSKTRVIAIARGLEGRELEGIANALYEGGIRLTEVTMNSPGALESISRLRTEFDGRMAIGAGTVTNLEQARDAAAAGAQFIVTPNIDRNVIEYCLGQELMITPGALTPSEIVKAISYGCTFVKVFPAGALGPEYIKAVRAPLNQVNLIAVGGITAENAGAYIRSGAYGLGVGGSLCRVPRDGDYARITREAEVLIHTCLASEIKE